VYFDTGSRTLNAASIAALGRLAPLLSNASSVQVVDLVGRSDQRGAEQSNRALSKARAEAVRGWLVAHGVGAAHVRALGAGALPGTDELVMQANRRVEIRAQVERRVGLAPSDDVAELTLASGWRVRKVPGGTKIEVVSPDTTTYAAYALKRVADRWAIYGRAATGHEVDVVIWRRAGEAVRAAWQTRAPATVGGARAGAVLQRRAEGELGAPPLVVAPPPVVARPELTPSGPPVVRLLSAGRPVSIKTNGAWEAGGHNAADVTDGDLSCQDLASDVGKGSIGWQNNDENQPGLVDVTINLGGAYVIRAIEYNGGDCMRASTWAADSITTPLGTFTPSPGVGSTGAWTRQEATSVIVASSVTMQLRKTKTEWARDWMAIGEFRIWGFPVPPPTAPPVIAAAPESGSTLTLAPTDTAYA
jgi:hypothetical protein